MNTNDITGASANDELSAMRASIHALTLEVERLTKIEARRKRLRRRGFQCALALSGLALAVSAAPTRAADGSCPNALPFCFSGGTPALASEINQNFDQLYEWMVAKVGSPGEAWVTVTSATDVGTGTGGGLVITGQGGTLRMDGNELEADSGAGLYLNWNSNESIHFIDTGTNLESVGSGVADDNTTSDAPYTRLNVDSFHSNGLGMGQLWMEGAYLDGNQTIRIGTGVAGAQSAQDVQMGGAVTGTSFNGKTLSGIGLTCRNISATDNSPNDDDETSVVCNTDEVVVGCSCYSSWNNCDGAYTSGDRTCTVRASGGGASLDARARCCKVH